MSISSSMAHGKVCRVRGGLIGVWRLESDVSCCSWRQDWTPGGTCRLVSRAVEKPGSP